MLSYSFVGVWASPLPGLPNMKPEVLKNLFGDPYTTNVGFGSDGLVVQKMMKPPAPMMVFGPQRFQVMCGSVEETVNVFGKLRNEIYAGMNQQVPLLAQIGLNTEHEWSGIASASAKKWLAERYIRKGLFNPPIEMAVEAQSLQFTLFLTSPQRQLSVTLQPRSEKEDGIYAAVNDHREWHKAEPQQDELAKLFADSAKEVDQRLAPLILGGVAENA